MTIIADQNLLDCLFDGSLASFGQVHSEEEAVPGGRSVERAGWDRTIDHLFSLSSLEPDWDGQRAIPPQSSLIASAIDLARWLRDQHAPLPEFATAGVNGTIQFEWFKPHVHCLTIEVVAPGEAEVFLHREDDHKGQVTSLRW